MRLSFGGASPLNTMSPPWGSTPNYLSTDATKTGAKPGGTGTVDKIARATGTIAGIVGDVRDIFGSGSKDPTPGYVQAGDPDYGGSQPSSAQQATGSLRRVFENLWDSARNTGEAAVRGGLTAAEAASTGARSGSALGASAINPTTLLLGAGALVLVLLLRK